MSSQLLNSLIHNVWAVALIVLFFGGSIFVHELGHFLAARRRGLKVDRFSIGFGPKIVSWMRDGVEYRISWLPFGGYVALPQLADMRGIEGEPSSAQEQLPPISYSSKMIVSIMGAVFNILFALVLSLVIWKFGLPTSDAQLTTQIGYVVPTIALNDGTKVTSPASYAGLKPGDRILAIDGDNVDSWMSLLQTLVSTTGRDKYGDPKTVLTIERDGKKMDVNVYPRVSGDENIRRIGVIPAEPLYVSSAKENSPAALAGVHDGDQILSVNGTALYSDIQLQDILAKNENKPLAFTIERNGSDPAKKQILTKTITPVRVTIGKDGTSIVTLGCTFNPPMRTIYPTPYKQFKENIVMLSRIFSALVNPRSDLSVANTDGPVGIAHIFYETAQVDIRLVIWFTILININLAFFNLLPIPVLDGGHMLFATIGKLRGQTLPANFIAAAQSVFMVLLFSLMIFVSYKDFGRMFRQSNRDQKADNNYIEPQFEKPNPAPSAQENAN